MKTDQGKMKKGFWRELFQPKTSCCRSTTIEEIEEEKPTGKAETAQEPTPAETKPVEKRRGCCG